MGFSRPVIVVAISAALFCLLSAPIAWGVNWLGEWQLVLWATDVRRPALTTAMQVLTFLAAARPALLISAGASAVMFWRQRRISRPVLLPVVALLGAVPFNLALRALFGRFRPGVSYVPNLIPEIRHPFQQWSYPSGHAITSVVVYGAVIYLVWIEGARLGPSRRFRHWRGLFLIVVMVLVGGLGFSRIYLGVHWPTDVLGGWLVGLSWLAMSIAWASRDKVSGRSFAERSREVGMIRNVTRGLDIASDLTYCNSFLRRGLGLMFRRSLRKDQALIFKERTESLAATAITMLFVSFPVAVIWLNCDKRVVDKVLACPWRLIYAPSHPACYYIEAHPSVLDKVEVGDRLSFPDSA